MTRRSVFIAAPLVVLLLGLASGWLSNAGYGNDWFDQIEKPWFMPPGWAFPVAWTTLYLLMGAAFALVLDSPVTRARQAGLGLFVVQLALNLAWSPIFFAFHQVSLALCVIIAMDVFVAATIIAFLRARPLAALLMLPYPCWLAIATALNWDIVRLNPGL